MSEQQNHIDTDNTPAEQGPELMADNNQENVVENLADNVVENVVDTEQSPPEATEVDSAGRIAELEKALLIAENKVKEQNDSVVRARADVENIRRRATMDVEKAHKFALEKFASELLPVLDNLERAIQFADKTNEDTKPIIDGVELTYQSFISSVSKFGMDVVDPQGEPFSPEFHQAVSIQESADHQPNTVMVVMQKGYTLNGRLLRPAMVMVSKGSSESVDTTA